MFDEYESPEELERQLSDAEEALFRSKDKVDALRETLIDVIVLVRQKAPDISEIWLTRSPYEESLIRTLKVQSELFEAIEKCIIDAHPVDHWLSLREEERKRQLREKEEKLSSLQTDIDRLREEAKALRESLSNSK